MPPARRGRWTAAQAIGRVPAIRRAV